MPLLIQGPRQPGNDIDVFLEPVIDELVEMFEKGVPDVCFEHSRGLLSGEKTKGYTRCVECLDDTNAVNLPNNSKIVYMGHRRFLPKDHPYRRNRKDLMVLLRNA